MSRRGRGPLGAEMVLGCGAHVQAPAVEGYGDTAAARWWRQPRSGYHPLASQGLCGRAGLAGVRACDRCAAAPRHPVFYLCKVLCPHAWPLASRVVGATLGLCKCRDVVWESARMTSLHSSMKAGSAAMQTVDNTVGHACHGQAISAGDGRPSPPFDCFQGASTRSGCIALRACMLQ